MTTETTRTESRTAELRRLAGAATPGPWDWASPPSEWSVWRVPTTDDDPGGKVAGRLSGDDARYIAALDPRTVLALLGVIDELAAMIPNAYCVFDRFETCGDPFCSEARAKRDAILARMSESSR